MEKTMKRIPNVEEDAYVVRNVRMKSGGGHYLGSLDFEEGFLQPYDRQTGYFESEAEVKKAYPESISWSEARDIAISRGWLEGEVTKEYITSDKQAEFDANFVEDDKE